MPLYVTLAKFSEQGLEHAWECKGLPNPARLYGVRNKNDPRETWLICRASSFVSNLATERPSYCSAAICRAPDGLVSTRTRLNNR